MENINVPYKVQTQIASFEGEWTAEQIDNGEAGESMRIENHVVWYEPTANGPVEITDEARIAELEARLRGDVEGA